MVNKREAMVATDEVLAKFWVRSSENLELRTSNRRLSYTSRESRPLRLSHALRHFATNRHE